MRPIEHGPARVPVGPARHEFAYLWPSFNNGYSLYDLLTPAQLQLSHQMVEWWGAFTKFGAPEAPGQPFWPTDNGGR